jgi:hypothetical protein
MSIANPYVTATYVSESYVGARGVLQAKLQEITWDSFAESAFIDRTWDEWFGDAWDFDAVAFTFSTASKTLGGYLFQPVISATAIANTSALGNFKAGGFGNHIAVASQTTDANKIVGIPATDFTGVASIDALAFSINFGEADITGIFTTDANGNYNITSPTASPIGIFNLDGNGTYLLAAGKASYTSIFSQSSNLNYVTAAGRGLFNAFAFELGEGRRIIPADPYFIIKVLQETRTFLLPIESRIIECLEETRVNSVETETKNILVPEETRLYKIVTPTFKQRSSIPRVRQEG